MPLSTHHRINQLLFGGETNNTPHSENFDPSAYLESLSSEDYWVTFCNWVVQYWLYNTDFIPNDETSLAAFDIKSLDNIFRERYIAGDWKVVIPNSGATAEETVLYMQMKNKMPCILILNEDKKPKMPELIEFRSGPLKPVLNSILIFLKGVSEQLKYKNALFISDDKNAHMINIASVNLLKRVIGYNESVTINGKSFLSKEHNTFGIDAVYTGNSKSGEWEISIEEFAKVFYGLPILKRFWSIWNQVLNVNVKVAGLWDQYSKK